MSLTLRGITGHLTSDAFLSSREVTKEKVDLQEQPQAVILIPAEEATSFPSTSSTGTPCPLIKPEEPVEHSTIASLVDILTSDRTKRIINYAANGSAVIVSLITFANGNLHIYDPIQGDLEVTSEFLSKAAFSTVHLIGAVALYEKKNFFPFVGYALGVPIGLLASGYNLLASIGIVSGLINLIVVIDQREVVDDNGNPIPDESGQTQVINGDFSDRGWRASFTTTLKEGKKMICELYNKPSRIKKISHAVFISGLVQIAGSLLKLCGFTNLGAYMTDTGTVASETSLLLHKNNTNSEQKKGIDLKSPIVQAGLLWNGAAIVDALKRLPLIFLEKISNLTELSLLLNRLASLKWTQGILNIKTDSTKKKD